MMKICFITTVPITLKSFVMPTAKYLHDKLNYDVTFVCSEDKGFAESLPDYIHYHPIAMRRGVNFDGISVISELRKLFRKEKFDIVQYSTPNASLYASIAAKLEKVPVRMYCQWGIRYVGLKGLNRKVFKSLEKTVCSLSTDIRAVSFQNMDFAISEGLYKRNKAKIVGNGGTVGVNMQEYDISKKQEWRKKIRERFEIGEQEFVFGFVGRLSKDKGGTELIKAFKMVAEKATCPVRLMLVGDNEANGEIDDSLMEWIRTYPFVIETGKVDNSNMKFYYSAFDVLVHPTYREGFGMVIQEAGAMGVPVITTRIPGASEVMEENKSCILVNPKETDELANAMELLLNDRDKIRLLGEEAFIRTKSLYERSVMLQFQELDYTELAIRSAVKQNS